MSPRFLAELDAGAEVVGAKGARLAEAAARGIRVPRATALTTEAHAWFLEANGLEEYAARVRESLAADGLAGIPALETERGRIHAELSLPGEIRKQLEAALGEVAAPGDPVILRSSANFEDGPGASLAGLFHSVPEVTGPDEAEEALLEIWSRAASAAVAAALLERDLDPAALRVAVLVQEYLPLERFATSFSLNPRDNAASPLVETRPLEDDASPDDSLSSIVLLSPEQRREAEELDARLGELLGCEVDLEIGWNQGGAVLLQARPQVITPQMRTAARWSRELTRERYPLPLSPLGYTNIEKVFVAAIRTFLDFLGRPAAEDAPVACQMEGLIFANQELFDLDRSVSLKLSPMGALGVGVGVLGSWLTRLRPLQDLKDLSELGQGGGRLGARPDSFAAEVSLRYVGAFLEESEREHIGDWDATLSTFLETVTSLEERIAPELEIAEFRELERALTRATIDFLGPDLVIYALKEVCFRVLEELLRLVGAPATRAELVAVLGVMDENPTTTMNRELLALARRQEEPGFEEELKVFLERYGHIACSWDVRDPLLGEEPEAVRDMLRTLATAPDPPPPATPGPRDEEALREHLAPFPTLREGFDMLAGKLRRYMKMDEEHHLYTSRVMGPSRRIIRHLGERLVDWGVLPDADAIHFLRDGEVWEILLAGDRRDRRFLVATRRAVFEQQREAMETEREAEPVERWSGLGAAVGMARGPTRRVANMRDAAAVRPGEILVVRTPDPAWTMVYPLAAGVVAETGALLSHGVVAAREHGIPVVVDLPGIFAAVRDGSMLTVDGASGEVHRVDEVGAPPPEPGPAEPA